MYTEYVNIGLLTYTLLYAMIVILMESGFFQFEMWELHVEFGMQDVSDTKENENMECGIKNVESLSFNAIRPSIGIWNQWNGGNEF